MSEELRNILTKECAVSRLKIISGEHVSFPQASYDNPVYKTVVLKYTGVGIFVPQSIFVGAYDAGALPLNVSPNSFSFIVKSMNGKLLQDGASLYNDYDAGAINNLLNYYDNFDNCVSLNSGEWWYLDIKGCVQDPGGFTAQPYAIGTEFLP